MSKLTIKLFNKIAITEGNQVTDETLLSAFNLEVASFGYTLAPALLAALRTLGDTAFMATRSDVIANLTEIKGADKKFIRLFNDFPYSTPDQHEYMEKRTLGHMANVYGITLGGNRLTPLSCGHVIDSLLFDIDSFGACPICQMQVDELSSDDVARFDYQSVTPLSALDLLEVPNGFQKECARLVGRQSSLSADEKEFLNQMIVEGIRFDLPETLYRENIPFAFKVFGDAIAPALSGATDIMRIAYYLSDEGADLSLSQNVRFKLKTSHKRALLKLLDRQKNLAEDMLRHRERWLRLGERLNPGSTANRARYPNVAKAFDVLRNAPEQIVTFNRQMESSMRAGVIDQNFVNLMIERPGEYARKLDYMLRSGDVDDVLRGLEAVASKIPERTLLDLRKYLGSRNDVTKRIFIPKGVINKMQVIDDKREKLSAEAVIKAIDIIDTDLRSRYGEKESMGKVFIDPLLKDVLLPFNRRGDSSSSSDIISKGSRFAFNGDYVRLFTWWKEKGGRTDVDLSVVTYDTNFNNMGHVAFTNLHDNGMVHSGDIQSAPRGASEFIDLDVNTLLSRGIRYVSSSVIVYSGNNFSTFECFVGFMERDAMRSGKVYEPESVKMRFDLKGETLSAAPLLFDLQERKVIYADMATGGRSYSAVSAQNEKQKALTEAMLSLTDRKPTVFDLIYLNAQARGELVQTREEADVVFGIDDAKKIIEEGVV